MVAHDGLISHLTPYTYSLMNNIYFHIELDEDGDETFW
jgi:hypothetical protein